MANQYDASFFMRVLMGLCTLANIFAFQAQPSFSRATGVSRATELRVAIDPSVVTKKEIDDIVGADFDKDVTAKRFNENKYLYPKHVEIIEDIAPIAEEMVNEIVSEQLLIFFASVRFWFQTMDASATLDLIWPLTFFFRRHFSHF